MGKLGRLRRADRAARAYQPLAPEAVLDAKQTMGGAELPDDEVMYDAGGLTTAGEVRARWRKAAMEVIGLEVRKLEWMDDGVKERVIPLDQFFMMKNAGVLDDGT